MRKPKQEETNEVRMELKYCEHCGGLWLRESGAGVVYCENCRPKVDDLPLPKRKPERIVLPVRQPTVVEGYEFDSGGASDGDAEDGDEMDFEGMGGVA